MTFSHIPCVLLLDEEAMRKVARDSRGFIHANVLVLAIVFCLSAAQIYLGLEFGLMDFETSLTHVMFALTVFFWYVLTWLMAGTLFFANKLIGNDPFTIKEVYSVLGHFFLVMLLAAIPYSALPVFIYLAALEIRTVQALAQTKLLTAIGTYAVAFILLSIVGNVLYIGTIFVGAYIEIATGSVDLF